MTTLGEAPPLADAVCVGATQLSRFDELRAELDHSQLAVLRGFLSGAALARILEEIESAEWELHRSTLKTELMMVENRASALLHFLMHNRQLFTLVQALTGSAPVGRFRGRTYRMLPGEGHTDPWHTDLVPGRAAAISINLSTRPLRDGRVEIRDAETHRQIAAAPPLACGDAVLLRIREGLQHRVRAVRGDNPRTAFAGFFYTDWKSGLAFPRLAPTAAESAAGTRR